MDYHLLLQQTLPLVEEAAAFIRSQAGKVTEKDVETKVRNSLVSYVDKSAEKMLVDGLKKILPTSGFITEEGTIRQEKSEYTWVIDPLDGTTNFLQNIPFYCVSVGLLHRDEMAVGIVCDVEHRETFYSWKGGGAWCNGNPIRVSQRQDILDAVVATGFPYAAENVSPALVEVFAYFLKNARGMRRLGSAALDLAYVACGRFDLYYETSLNAWDIAGGILLVREAGGMVSDFEGGQRMLDTGYLISANSKVFPAAAATIQKFFTP